MHANAHVPHDLVEALHIQGVSAGDQLATIGALGEVIMKQFIINVLDRLSEEGKVECKKLIAEDVPEKLFTFIFAYVENAEELFLQTAHELMHSFVKQVHL